MADSESEAGDHSAAGRSYSPKFRSVDEADEALAAELQTQLGINEQLTYQLEDAAHTSAVRGALMLAVGVLLAGAVASGVIVVIPDIGSLSGTLSSLFVAGLVLVGLCAAYSLASAALLIGDVGLLRRLAQRNERELSSAQYDLGRYFENATARR